MRVMDVLPTHLFEAMQVERLSLLENLCTLLGVNGLAQLFEALLSAPAGNSNWLSCMF